MGRPRKKTPSSRIDPSVHYIVAGNRKTPHIARKFPGKMTAPRKRLLELEGDGNQTMEAIIIRSCLDYLRELFEDSTMTLRVMGEARFQKYQFDQQLISQDLSLSSFDEICRIIEENPDLI